jgi:hypothetical protein
MQEWNWDDALSVREQETSEKWQVIVSEKDAEIADKDAEIADKDALIADKDALIAALKKQLNII